MTDDEKAYSAFEEYRHLKLLADRTLKFRDAENAGAAWARFINHFVPPEQKLLTSNVVPIHRRKVQ